MLKEEEITKRMEQIDDQKIRINTAVIYAPQENVTRVKELRKMYESITKEIQDAREHKQQVIVLGDFNAKVGTKIQGNKETITKGERLLLKIIQKEIMSLVNADKHRCKGLWTREQGKQKSVFDYVINSTEYLNSIKEMIIDETKEHATYILDQENQDLEKKYSDHNVILLKIDFHTETIQIKKRKIVTIKGYKEYRENIKQLEISKLIAFQQ